MALESTPDEIKAFLEQLAAQAEITDFIQNLGRDLVASGVLRAEEFDKTPGMLQVAKLKSVKMHLVCFCLNLNEVDRIR
jgi:PP-loop superfamily ATP-utilizing enzyme